MEEIVRLAQCDGCVCQGNDSFRCWKPDIFNHVLLIGTPVIGTILVFICIYFSYKYYIKRDNSLMKKRYPKLVLYQCVISLLLTFVISYRPVIEVLMPIKIIWSTFGWTWIFLLCFGFYSWLWRFWMIHYHIRWTRTTLNHEWKSIIDESLKENDKKSWYIRRQKTFGNPKWFLLWIIIPITVFTIIVVAFQWLVLKPRIAVFWIGGLLWFFAVCVPCLLLLVLWIMTPEFHDNIYLVKELKMVFYANLLYVIWQFGVIIIDKKYYEFYFLITTIDAIITIILHVSTILISTKWVLSKFDDNEHHVSEVKKRGKKVKVEIVAVYSRRAIEFGKQTIDSLPERLSLHDILKDKRGVESFMEHTIHEFSIENLLSIIELIQFRQYLSQLCSPSISESGESIDKLLQNDIEFSKTVPKSSIVYNDEDSFRLRAWKLYQKYIDSDAEYEINISYRCRLKLRKLFSNKDEWLTNNNYNNAELLNIFNETINEVFNLMSDSFVRFQSSKEYSKLMKRSQSAQSPF